MDYSKTDSDALFQKKTVLAEKAKTGPLTPEMSSQLRAIEEELALRRYRLVGRSDDAERDFALCRSAEECRDYAQRKHLALDCPVQIDGVNWVITVEELPNPEVQSMWDRI